MGPWACGQRGEGSEKGLFWGWSCGEAEDLSVLPCEGTGRG